MPTNTRQTSPNGPAHSLVAHPNRTFRASINISPLHNPEEL